VQVQNKNLGDLQAELKPIQCTTAIVPSDFFLLILKLLQSSSQKHQLRARSPNIVIIIILAVSVA